MVLASLSLTVAARARADGEGDAKDLFDRGRSLRAAGDCASAAPLFQRAYEIHPSGLGSLRNLAECDESLGRWASARRAWLDLGRALLLNRDGKYQGWDRDAEASARRLEPRVPHLTIQLAVTDAKPQDVEVTLNGERVAPALYGTVLDRDPGSYTARARVSGVEVTSSVELSTGSNETLRLELHAPAPSPPRSPAPLAPTEREASAPRETSSAWPVIGFVTLGVGAAALVGMGIAIGVRQDALSTLQASCPSYTTSPCPSSLRSVVDRGQAASTATTALAIGGGVATAAGIVMILAGHRTGPRVAVGFFGTGGSVAWSF